MALGVPVIGSRVGGLAEVIENDRTGLLVEPNSEKALANAIGRLIADAPLRARLGKQAQFAQREAYSVQAMAEAYVAVYHDVCEGHA
jgi:glycosyltransferase involved in cell wall biosynthesis